MPSKSVERRLAAQGVETREERRVFVTFSDGSTLALGPYLGTYGDETEQEIRERRERLSLQLSDAHVAHIESRTVTVGPWRRVEEE
jgi:hypothetical protein